MTSGHSENYTTLTDATWRSAGIEASLNSRPLNEDVFRQPCTQGQFFMSRGNFRVCYLDASLIRHNGHWANACRQLTGEFRRRGFACDIYGNRAVLPPLARELDVVPLFRNRPYEPVASKFPEISYFFGRLAFLQDIRKAWASGPYDLVYINSILPPELSALARWLQDFPASRTPNIVVEFGEPSGMSLPEGGHYSTFTRRTEFFKRAAREISSQPLERVLFFTFDEAASCEYAELLGRPVAVMSPVHSGVGAPRRREKSADGGVTIAFLGGQRPEKGYALVPDIIRLLRQRGVDHHILVHNGSDPTMTEDATLAEMSARDAKLTFECFPADQKQWQQLLDRSDLVVLPYDPPRYRNSYSAVACEAVSDGIPIVAPADTTMAELCRNYQKGAVQFTEWTAASVADAICRALTDFTLIADQAHEGAYRWRSEHGAAAFVDRLLDWMPDTSAGSAPPVSLSRAHIAVATGLTALFSARDAVIRWLKLMQKKRPPAKPMKAD